MKRILYICSLVVLLVMAAAVTANTYAASAKPHSSCEHCCKKCCEGGKCATEGCTCCDGGDCTCEGCCSDGKCTEPCCEDGKCSTAGHGEHAH